MNCYSKFKFDLIEPAYLDSTLAKRLTKWLSDGECGVSLYDEQGDCEFLEKLRAVIWCHPNLDTCKDSGKVDLKFIKLWVSGEARDKGRAGRTQMKVGKAFKYMWPFLTPVQLEHLVDAFKKEFSPKDYYLVKGKTRKHFANAYVETREKQQNMPTSEYVKHLGNSCMSNKTFEFYGGDDNVTHPCEIYASGDFTQYALTVGKGSNIMAARCVVYTNASPYRAAPIYATSEAAADKIKRHILDDCPNTDFCRQDMTGASVLVLSCHCGVIAPYFDFRPNQFDSDGILRNSGEFCGDDHVNAIARDDEDSYTCENCSETFNMEQEGGTFSDSCYCDECYSEIVGYCEFSDESCLRDEMSEVIVSDRGYTQYWHDDVVSDNAVKVDGYLYSIESGMVFMSDFSGDWHLIEDHCETSEGESATPNELACEENEWTHNDNDGLWYKTDLFADVPSDKPIKENALQEVAQ
jgi:hypothetical protein